VWVDALEEKIKVVLQKITNLENHSAIQVALSDTDGKTVTFNEANNGQSSSLLNFGTHADSYPDIEFIKEHNIVTSRFDSLVQSIPLGTVLVNLDVQGVELPVLQGFGALLDDVNYIYTEVNTEEVYENCALLVELQEFLANRGFQLVDLRMTGAGWGDAFFVQSNFVPTHTIIRSICSRILTAPVISRLFR